MRNYRLLSTLISPFIPLWLSYRTWQGKEDKARIGERYGITQIARPEGVLFWIHAASVGEANSILPLLDKIRAQFSSVKILLTTGTVTSAKLMQQRSNHNFIHQFVPIDTPKATQKFIWHWRPDFAFLVESELWPNLIDTTHDYGCLMGLINARMSERSFRSWQKRPHLIAHLLSCFDLIFAQSEADASRLRALGAKDTVCFGNVKYDAPMLSCDENALLSIQNHIGIRPVWLAASTHPGEESLIAEAHVLLRKKHPQLLTIIVPRHSNRGEAIAAEIGKQANVALRSKQPSITPDTAIYIADTMGELGLWYRVSEIVFMGGSLVKHGGQNPLEPARLSCAVVTGPYTHNFSDIYTEMSAINACLHANDVTSLVEQVERLLDDANARDVLQTNARRWLQEKGGATDKIIDILEPAITHTRSTK